ncbi:MAG: sigma54 specific transcriptional regulator [Firmicutes bacterium]|nr:sigma54 specific transcriptional regulator [Bacillota bacterium]
MLESIHNKDEQILANWNRFILSRILEPNVVRPEIAASWDRCYTAGVDPYDGVGHRVLHPVELKKLLAEKKTIIEIAKPFMDNLYNFVAGSGFIVLLTDEEGYVMETMGDPDVLEQAAALRFFQGANWTEQEVGTNAIGTAIALKRPLQVSGAEHYCQKHHAWTCSAAPVCNPHGRMIGILNLSGPSRGTHLHTLGMVVAAGAAITAQMTIQSQNHELTVTNSRLTNIFNTMSEGLIMVDRLGIIQELNPVAHKILGADRELLGTMVEKIFGKESSWTRKIINNKQSYSDLEIMVETKRGLIHCLVSGEPIIDEMGLVTGGVILLQPIQQVRKLVNRFSGNYSTLKFNDIVGESKEIRDAVHTATLAANSKINVLLEGESGVGKEIFAQAIHNHGATADGPFVAINCGIIPRELVGSELFGYEDGAFTGAKRGGKPGKFEMADGGTLFLDEIGDMTMDEQIALLRVLQERKVVRIGGDKVITVDVRVICATNKNLLEAVEKGTFRNDLYYRLNVVRIVIPPLRDRGEDTIMLFRYFLDRISRERDWHYELDPEVILQLRRYHWPGNVRELHNIAERVVSLAEGPRISLVHLPAELLKSSVQRAEAAKQSLPLSDKIVTSWQLSRKQAEEAERKLIINTLARQEGNISRSAQEIGIARSTLYRKMRQYTIDG